MVKKASGSNIEEPFRLIRADLDNKFSSDIYTRMRHDWYP